MSDFEEYKPMDVEHNVKAAVENLRKAYWSNETEKVAKHFTEAEDKIISAICHLGYTVCKETTEGDCISREDLKKAIEEVEDNYDGYEPNDLGKFMNKVYDLIDNAPTVEARPKGEWEVDLKTYDKQHRTVFYCCSICGHKENCIIEKTASEQNPFCKICGADMRGGAE